MRRAGRLDVSAQYFEQALASDPRHPGALSSYAMLLLEGGDVELGRTGFLAGLDGFEAARAPRAGETLTVDVRLSARFGPVVRFDGEVTSGGEQIARGGILVRQGKGAPASAA